MLQRLGPIKIEYPSNTVNGVRYVWDNCHTEGVCTEKRFQNRKCQRCSNDQRFRVPALLFLTVAQAARKLRVTCNDVHELLKYPLPELVRERLENKINGWLIVGSTETRQYCRAKCLKCNTVHTVNYANICYGLSKQCVDCGQKDAQAKNRRFSTMYPQAYKNYSRIRHNYSFEECWDTFKKFVRNCPAILLEKDFTIRDRDKPCGPNNYKIGAVLDSCLTTFQGLPWTTVAEKLGVTKQRVHQIHKKYGSYEALPEHIKEKVWGQDNSH